jgi:hypothetical protein
METDCPEHLCAAGSGTVHVPDDKISDPKMLDAPELFENALSCVVGGVTRNFISCPR